MANDANALPTTSVPSPSGAGTNGLTNNPGITPDGKITRRAVTSSAQALTVAQALDNDGQVRDQKAAMVEEEYNGQAPFNAAKLKNAKQDWRYNISTQFLMSLIDRRAPSPVRSVESAAYLTNSALPDKNPQSIAKTLKFRKRITTTIRSWPGWREFLYKAALENLLQGYCAAAWPSRYDWRVNCYKQTDFRVPDGTSLKAEECETFVARAWWKPSKLLDRIINEEAAEAGWNIENCVKAINEAAPKQKASGADSVGKSARDIADLQREGSLALNYQNGEVGIDCWDCKFLEIDGRVTQYIIRKDGLELFKSEDAYNSMGYCVQFLSIEEGNSVLYGSRGVGRKLFNIARAAEKSRNMYLDAVGFSGYKWFQRDPNDTTRKSRDAQINVAAPMVTVNMKGTPIQGPAFTGEAFIQANQLLTTLAEGVAGTILPTQQLTPAQDDKTATQAKIEAGREEELKASVLERWVIQISNVVSIMQQRLCDPDTTDQVALDLQRELREIDGLTEQEIIDIAKQPAAQSIYSSSTVLLGQLKEIAATWGATGAINMKKLARMAVQASVDESTAKEILTDQLTDEQAMVSASRDQMGEFCDMLEGLAPPVIASDNHQGHLEGALGIIGAKQELLTPEAIDIELAKAVGMLLEHCQGHVAGLKDQGAPEETIEKYSQAIAQGEEMLKVVIAKRAEMENPTVQPKPQIQL